jgi:hypothetical protein
LKSNMDQNRQQHGTVNRSTHEHELSQEVVSG